MSEANKALTKQLEEYKQLSLELKEEIMTLKIASNLFQDEKTKSSKDPI